MKKSLRLRLVLKNVAPVERTHKFSKMRDENAVLARSYPCVTGALGRRSQQNNIAALNQGRTPKIFRQPKFVSIAIKQIQRLATASSFNSVNNVVANVCAIKRSDAINIRL